MAASTLNVVSRITASLIGGYAFTWGFTALGIVLLAALNDDFHEAETGMHLLAFLVFLAAFLWSFAAVSLVRLWMVLAGGGALMTVAAWALQRAVLA
jgi:hypothetical protein